MVGTLRQGHYGMVIGSYTLVDSGLKEIPPGLIDHREWTDENGHTMHYASTARAPRGL
jgi:hypothetical protein